MSTYTTKKIDELPVADALQDGCALPICQDGTAKRLTGAQLKAFAESAAKNQIRSTKVEAVTLDPGEDATVQNSVDESGNIVLTFGIPKGTSNNVYVVDANASDISSVDFSSYNKGDVVLVTMST